MYTVWIQREYTEETIIFLKEISFQLLDYRDILAFSEYYREVEKGRM